MCFYSRPNSEFTFHGNRIELTTQNIQKRILPFSFIKYHSSDNKVLTFALYSILIVLQAQKNDLTDSIDLLCDAHKRIKIPFQTR